MKHPGALEGEGGRCVPRHWGPAAWETEVVEGLGRPVSPAPTSDMQEARELAMLLQTGLWR